MGELLVLSKPDERRQRAVVVTSVDTSITSYERVDRVSATIMGRAAERRVSLIEKSPSVFAYDGTLGHFDYQMEGGVLYYDIWKRLINAKIPVVDNLWLVSASTVAMTDMTAMGGRFYDKYEYFSERLFRQNPDKIDRVFGQLKRGHVLNTVREILNNANEHLIALNTDDPLSLLVRPDNSWRVVALDISGTRFGHQDTIKLNQQNLIQFMGYFDRMREWMGIYKGSELV